MVHFVCYGCIEKYITRAYQSQARLVHSKSCSGKMIDCILPFLLLFPVGQVFHLCLAVPVVWDEISSISMGSSGIYTRQAWNGELTGSPGAPGKPGAPSLPAAPCTHMIGRSQFHSQHTQCEGLDWWNKRILWTYRLSRRARWASCSRFSYKSLDGKGTSDWTITCSECSFPDQ